MRDTCNSWKKGIVSIEQSSFSGEFLKVEELYSEKEEHGHKYWSLIFSAINLSIYIDFSFLKSFYD